MGNSGSSSSNLDQKSSNDLPEFEDLEEIQRQKQQDLQRRERLAMLERQQYDEGYQSPQKQKKPDFDSLCPEEQISHILEQLLQVSIVEEQGNQFFSLKEIENDLIDPKLKKPLLNKQNVQDFVIYEVLQSKIGIFFENHEERVKYLFSVIKKCANNKNIILQKNNFAQSDSEKKVQQQQLLISADDYDEIIESSFNYMITLLTQYESFDLEGIQDEKHNNIFDISNILLDAFYNNFNRYSAITFNEVMDRLSKHDEFHNIMNSVFKRIYNNIREKGSIENMDPFSNSIDRMKQLFTKDYILDYFLNSSPLFYSESLKYGLYLEGNTIFGLMLSLTTFPDQWEKFMEVFKQVNLRFSKEVQKLIQEDTKIIRKKINEFHKLFYQLLNIIAKKRKDRLIFWIEKILDMNKGILKTYHSHEHCSSPGFLYNFLRILLHFTQSLTLDFNTMNEVINNLDLNIITEPTGFYKFFDHIQIFDKEKYEKEILKIQMQKSGEDSQPNQQPQEGEKKGIVGENQEEEQKQSNHPQSKTSLSQDQTQNIQFISQIYRFVMAAIHLNLPFFKTLKSFQEKLHQASHFNQHNVVEINNFLIKQKEKLSYNILIEDPYINSMLIKFFELQVLYCWKLNNQQYDEKGIINQLQTEYTQKYAQLPFFFIEDINEFTSLVLILFPKIIQEFQSSFQKIIDCQIIMMGNKQWCNNPHFRQKIIEIFSMIIGFDRNNALKESSPSFLLNQGQVCQEYMIPGLLKVFIEIEKSTDGHHHQHQLNEKFIFRYHFCKIFTYLLENQEKKKQDQEEEQANKIALRVNQEMKINKICSNQLIKISQQNKIMFLEFANLYFNDLIFLLDIISNYMCKFFHFQTLNRNQVNHFVYHQKESEAKQSQQHVKKYYQYLAAYYKNIETLSLYSEDIFLQDEIKLKLTNFINISFMKILTYHHLDQLNEKAQKELGFDLKTVVLCIVKLYIQYSQYDKFVQTLVEDERIFDIEAFKKSVSKLQTLNILSESIQNEFNSFQSRVIEMYEEKQRTEALLYAEVPEKYLDPLLNQIMTDPVKLPKSEVIIDRVTIVKHLLNDKTDPFTRDQLQESDLIPMLELKQEISEFINQQLQKNKLKKQAKNIETEEQKDNEEAISTSSFLSEMVTKDGNEGSVTNQAFNLNEIRSDMELQSSNNIGDDVLSNDQQNEQ
ncbi:ubiquitin elongating factor core protein (macronuclear) [Tetrahymena thermophila SB210]|uniref:RING-type E3 ubiquitin transferase n=1 Tax=Tetrahymena thermophila (strain SB210) TaxID=312017 RepID=Q22WA2_TETTS|nr:ubiquitin elongating factor core protein [Tetrahymena thermophila SB210]EAR89515.2 ubiquitin elongating factor core protein [Tetrahymena thermophila SB210]|eukprot:XP_001009760.2 ubiquitin elongating factor core protein [Tetrahymena thermophila SB210]